MSKNNWGEIIRVKATNAKHQFLIGTSGWTYDHWKGLFYPKNLPKRKWFEYYGSFFSTVEVNATFYRSFKDQTYLNWREHAPVHFRYVLKAPRWITHRKYLLDAEQEIEEFSRSAALLEDRLGLILLQVAPGTPYDPDRLKRALLAFGNPNKVAIEFRHKNWFTDEIRDLLCTLGVVFCTADSPKTRLSDWVTSDTAYIRLHGRQRWYSHNYTDQELHEIADLAIQMAEQGAERIYIFFNNDFEGYAPQNALTLQQMLG